VSQKLLNSGYSFRSGGYIKTARRSLGLGGHVHFDFPFVAENDKRVYALNGVTSLLEELDILPKLQSGYRHRYQAIDTIRKANDANRLEYRYMCSWLHSPITTQLCLTAAKLAATHPESVSTKDISVAALQSWFEQFKNKDDDADRVIEKIFEPKLKLEAKIDVDLQDSWKSLKKLGGSGNEVGAAL
jgi:hypothetical protein